MNTSQVAVHSKPSSQKRTSYPSGYKGPREIADQVVQLADQFSINPIDALNFLDRKLPTWVHDQKADGLFAWPSISAIAKRHFPTTTDPAEQYCKTVVFLLDMFRRLNRTCLIRAFDLQDLTSSKLQMSECTVLALGSLAKDQKGDILIADVQLGYLYDRWPEHSYSPKQNQTLIEQDVREFGLSAFAIGSIILTHPRRLQSWDDLGMVSSDEFKNEFDGTLQFRVHDGTVHSLCLAELGVDHDFDRFSAVTGFLPL